MITCKSSDLFIKTDCSLPFASDKHFCWMAVNNPGTTPFFETASRKNTLNAPNDNDSVLKGVNDHRGNTARESWGC